MKRNLARLIFILAVIAWSIIVAYVLVTPVNADAAPVVRCEKCVLHGNCVTKDAFVLAGIENPFCCAGKTKEGAD